MTTLLKTARTNARSFDNFTSRSGGINLRTYQSDPAQAIINSIKHKYGDTIVLIISRQAGKDELLANLISYLLALYSSHEKGIVIANPTYKPQTINSIMRLENRLKANTITKMIWGKRSDYMRTVHKATASFLSGDGSANVVGAVASLLLIVNEAQDISPAVYDKNFAPMVASTNATRLIVGTVWTSNTLLAREENAAREAEKLDGRKRVFFYTADDVRQIVPDYGKFVDSEIQKLGREHPLVKTQYFCERIDSQAGMFNAGRMALMQGDQPAHETPQPDHIYCFLIDVAGQDEASMNLEENLSTNPGRDQLTLSIVSVDLSSLELLQAPTYRVVKRFAWTGQNHVSIFGQLQALSDNWTPLYIVIDATGVGEGLWAMLDHANPTRVLPVKFSQAVKSEIGYQFLAIINTGRFRDCAPSADVHKQYTACTSEILIGPAKTMRWRVPDGTRDENGLLIHDDYIMADALVSQLDKLQWMVSSPTLMTTPKDIFKSMDRSY
ncbi:hypothetical protein [Candidatus Villigracilis saccharophilus]|uniref:phage terminase large subunit family protein n=1 Tax=Candidatus Villigracilis saccharophilus TaxID=3140684 RepID=UPI00313706C8|nr:hypothetical protein [Anaerolineales bacterium]